MKKSNRKGFILAETIAVSTIVMTSLVILYSQFVSINNSYNRSFSYNNVNNLYLVKNIRDYLSEENLNKLISSMEESNSLYIDITSCPNEYFTEYIYCETLLNTINVKTILFTKENVNELKDKLKDVDLTEKMKSFINYINSTTDNNYRLIVEFNDDTYATLKVKI